MYIDDDRDYILPLPETHFIGYKCPHFQCNVIMTDHEYCRSVRMRLDTIAGERLFISHSDFIERFKFNFDQFMKKSPTVLSVR